MDPLAAAFAAVAVVLAAMLIASWLAYRRLVSHLRRTVRHIGGDERRAPLAELDLVVERIEERLAEIERRSMQYHGAVHGARVGIMVVDPEGSVVFANTAAEKFIDARHGDAVAEVRVRELIERSGSLRRPESAELELYTPTRRVLQLATLPLVHAGELQGIVAYVDDLTERRQTDTMRRDFVANVSHELKTPLGALAVLAETLGDEEDSATRERLASRLREEAQRMAQLVDDILSLSHLESGAGNPVPVELADVLDHASKRVLLAAEEHGVTLEVTGPDRPTLILGHQDQLVSAVANLLDNAIKYTGPGTAGESGRVTVRSVRDDGWVTVEVEDNGIGIPRAHQARIFERFYRVDRGRGRGTGGTGLGLAIVRHVALNHGGGVTVDSNPGTGTVFRFQLPVMS